ncbi:hypothetical protein OSB04_008191 [Centaurea solstitialis]|uniref:GDSL esterase/lipase n=1 Tax=Centaurea solstitialis TaxID=347529 RepID=A0AA38WTQ8_9ASTR|nr:hypothetical protein OSB04_008191 [Centaurea solstitialis]
MATCFLLVFMLLLSWLVADGCYTSIISFGDSLADTGNIKELDRYYNIEPPHFLFLPYGETYFHKPTGRCSNGRLIIDFVAEGLGLPLIPPFTGWARINDGDREVMGFKQGMNYAVAGATALDSSFLEARGVHNPLTNASLGVQLEWFKESLPLLCSTSSGKCFTELVEDVKFSRHYPNIYTK